jgi:DNA modification methylase
MKIEIKKLKDLIPSEYNPRKTSKEQEKALSESLKKYGCVEPIVVNEYKREYELKDEQGNILLDKNNNPLRQTEDRNNIIIGGHFRVRELLKLKVEEVECAIVNLNKEDERELNIRLNSNTGDWNIDKLLSNFNLQELDDWGFDKGQLEHLSFRTEEDKLENDLINDEQDIPNIPPIPKTKLGDMFMLGDHRLLCGDSTNEESVKLLMTDNITVGNQLTINNHREVKNTKQTANISNNNKRNTNLIVNYPLSTVNYKKADLIITDPPYNVSYGKGRDIKKESKKQNKIQGKTQIKTQNKKIHGKILNDELKDKEFYDFLFKTFKNCNDLILREGGVIYVFHSDSERINFTKSFQENNLYFSQILIWVKNNFVLGRNDYQNKHESIMYGWKKGRSHYFINNRTQGNVLEDKIDIHKLKKEELLKILENILSDKTETTVMHYDKPLINDLHPTMKPIKLLGRFIINSSKPKDLIVDPFGGSGSTLIASEQLNRQCYMMELEPKYCDVIIERWQNLTKKEAIRYDGVRYNDL